MSQADELLAKARAKVAVAKAGPSAEAWRHLDEIDMLLRLAQGAMLRPHLCLVKGTAARGFGVFCSCGWAAAAVNMDYPTAAAAGQAHTKQMEAK